MKIELSTFIAGMERTVVADKQMLGLKIPEGKKTISIEAYELLSNTLFESREKRDIFAHLFLVLDWFLTKRAENCVNAKIYQIHFHSGCLVFEFAKSKCHKKGENNLVPWHIYANQ